VRRDPEAGCRVLSCVRFVCFLVTWLFRWDLFCLGSKRDFASPFIVFELNYATGNRADNDVDDDEDMDASSAVIQPVPVRPPAPADGLAGSRVGLSPVTSVRRGSAVSGGRGGSGGSQGSRRDGVQAAGGGRVLQVAPGAREMQHQNRAPRPHTAAGSVATRHGRQNDARTQMD